MNNSLVFVMVGYLTATCLFCLDIDGLGLDVPPGSPSSVRSSGDGSSCDTPPVNQCSSSTEDGRTERGKYCDCCYCEFFGHAAVSTCSKHNYYKGSFCQTGSLLA